MVKKVLKVISRTLWVLVALVAVFVIFNQFDAGKNPRAFSEKDLPPANFDKSNGFYRLWALCEPPEVDIDSDAVIDKYRKLFYPEFNEKYHSEFYYKAYKDMFSNKDRETIKNIFEKADLKWPLYRGNWSDKILAARDDIGELKTAVKPLLDNYQKFINSDVIEDFTAIRGDSLLPNLLAWMKVGRVYNVVNIWEALQGNWQTGAANILAHVDAVKKTIKGSRSLIINIIAKRMLRESTYMLSDLMNREDCPGEIFEKVFNGLPPIEYEEYGTRNDFICENLMCDHYIDHFPEASEYSFVFGLFLQENRTKKYLSNYFIDMIEHEKTQPYRWQSPPSSRPDYKKGCCWWLQNGTGKVIASELVPNLLSAINKAYLVKSIYDMVRITAELHLKYDPQKSVAENLKELESYKTPDPYSGKPYTWNQKKQVFYGIGADRKDDGGRPFDYPNLTGDFVVPCILYIK